jgi:hypothetical protein
MVHTELYCVLRHRQPPPQKLDVTHTQGDRFSPPDAGVRQHEYYRSVLAGFVGEPVHIIRRQVHAPLARLAWQARVWPGPAAWPDLLCAKLTTNMSHKQWDEWVSPDIDYIQVCPDLPIAPD